MMGVIYWMSHICFLEYYRMHSLMYKDDQTVKGLQDRFFIFMNITDAMFSFFRV